MTPSNACKSHPGRLFVISAPSGAGKTTLCRALLGRFPEMAYSISFTTRAPRPGEHDGHDYHFTDQDTFEQGIADGHWAEWARVHGHYYGTRKSDLEQHLKAGRDILLDIDFQGMQQIVAVFPESITIFILPPSLETLRKRLQERDTDHIEEIERRMDSAREEIQHQHQYQHRIINDDLPGAIKKLAEIVDGRQPTSSSLPSRI